VLLYHARLRGTMSCNKLSPAPSPLGRGDMGAYLRRLLESALVQI
jgi:hypothetical protein